MFIINHNTIGHIYQSCDVHRMSESDSEVTHKKCKMVMSDRKILPKSANGHLNKTGKDQK